MNYRQANVDVAHLRFYINLNEFSQTSFVSHKYEGTIKAHEINDKEHLKKREMKNVLFS